MLAATEVLARWSQLRSASLLSMATLRELGQTSDIPQQTLRSICWKLYLEYLPGLTDLGVLWPDALAKERTHYDRLRGRFIDEPSRQLRPHESPHIPTNHVDLRVHNPLSLANDSPWQQYFQDAELKQIIQRDVVRTFPDQPYFQSPRVQDAMLNILFVYCKMHSDISYRQGMHEILAPLWLAVDEDSVDHAASAPHTLAGDEATAVLAALDAKFAEHDAFILFCRVMQVIAPWFETSDSPLPRTDVARSRQAQSPPSGGHILRSLQRLKVAEVSRSAPVLAKSHDFFHRLLKTIDPPLYQHLVTLDIEPQLYGIRWLRLLWSREFAFADVLRLWDALWADDAHLGAVEYLCVAMLIRIRHLLLAGDEVVCLQTLMRFPGLELAAQTRSKAFVPPFPHRPTLHAADLYPIQFLFQQALFLRRHTTLAAGLLVIAQNDALLGHETTNEPLHAVDAEATMLPTSRLTSPPGRSPVISAPVHSSNRQSLASVVPPVKAPRTALPGKVSDRPSVPTRLKAQAVVQLDRNVLEPTVAILEKCEQWLRLASPGIPASAAPQAPAFSDAATEAWSILTTERPVAEDNQPAITSTRSESVPDAATIVGLVIQALRHTTEQLAVGSPPLQQQASSAALLASRLQDTNRQLAVLATQAGLDKASAAELPLTQGITDTAKALFSQHVSMAQHSSRRPADSPKLSTSAPTMPIEPRPTSSPTRPFVSRPPSAASQRRGLSPIRSPPHTSSVSQSLRPRAIPSKVSKPSAETHDPLGAL
ncbi:hypothetical protein H4R34_002459 [Dimargaris verticillata]|uniref:Rab-GAP TBC domain-containing protein n=1 Tax=Dimargaris verticillata TaxID=2761393 RepID=A0A9W8E9Z0_9FUNG|nr:hypothetical protein H4R34_002459 [Dimargaris verticillata]